MIEEKILRNLINEKVYDNILWEYDSNLIQIIKKKAGDNSSTYNLKYNNISHKYDIIIILKKNYFKGYCNCDIGKQGKNCEHLIWAGIKINEEVKIGIQQKEKVTSNNYKLELFKNIKINQKFKEEIIITPNLQIADNIKLNLKIKIESGQEYKVPKIIKLITDINLKKELKYGKNLNIADYRIDYKSSELIKILEYISLKKE